MSNVQLPKVAYSPTRFLATPKFIYFELDYDFLNNLCIVFSMEQFKIKLFQAFWICSSSDELYTVPFLIHMIFISVSKVIIAFYLSVSCKFYIITLVFYTTSYLQLFFYLVNFFFSDLVRVWTVMTSRFRLPAGRTYNVRASELARDRQHTEVVCNILLLDNTVQAFKVNVSILVLFSSNNFWL